MTLVYKEEVDGPVTHAIVIGVGAYKHLLGGDGKLFKDHGKLGQLTSPPHSARAFAHWFTTEFNNKDKPLATLDLLISDKQSDEFKINEDEIIKVNRATMKNVEDGILHWNDRGDENRDNLMIFYFCGHGIESGARLTLLLEDFGTRQKIPLREAIDFHDFHLGMDKCEARQQCYFIDACRMGSYTLIESAKFKGNPIIYGSARHSVEGRRYAPIYYSTLDGERAYARLHSSSIFTEALIRALKGAGSDNVEGDWRVDTDTLNRGINYLMQRAVDDIEQIHQRSPVDGLIRFTFHYITGKPIIPVTVGCDPSEANGKAQLSYSELEGQKSYERDEISPSEWEIDIPEGKYRFSARFPNKSYKDNNVEHPIRPPFRPIRIEVRP